MGSLEPKPEKKATKIALLEPLKDLTLDTKTFSPFNNQLSLRSRAALSTLVSSKNSSLMNDDFSHDHKINREKFLVHQNRVDRGIRAYKDIQFHINKPENKEEPTPIASSTLNLFKKDCFIVNNNQPPSPTKLTEPTPRLSLSPRKKNFSAMLSARQERKSVPNITSPNESQFSAPNLGHRKTLSSLVGKSESDTIYTPLNRKLPQALLIKDFSRVTSKNVSQVASVRSQPQLTQKTMVNSNVINTVRTQRNWKKLGLENQMPRVASNERKQLSNFLVDDYITKLINDKDGVSNAELQEVNRKKYIQALKKLHTQQEDYFSKETVLAEVERVKGLIYEETTKFKLLRHSQVPVTDEPKQEEIQPVKAFRRDYAFMPGTDYPAYEGGEDTVIERNQGPQLMGFQLVPTEGKYPMLKPLVDPKTRYAFRESCPSLNRLGNQQEPLLKTIRNFGEFDDGEGDSSPNSPAKRFNRRLKNEKFVKIRAALKNVLEKLGRLKIQRKEIVHLNKIFCTKPYERPGSLAFLKAVKAEDTITVESMLNQNKFFVLDFDQVTLFHWRWL